MKSVKVWGFVAVLALVLAVLAGCSSSAPKEAAPAPSPSSGNTQSQQAADSAPQVQPEEPKQELDYPKQDLQVIIPFGAGGGTDQVGRLLMSIAEEKFPKNIIGTNVTGGGGAIGFAELMQAKPDGHTIAVATTNLALNPAVGTSDISYEAFDHIITVNFDSAALIVRSDSPWQTAEEFIEHAREHEVDVATASPGGNWYIGAVDLIRQSGVKLNLIPGAQGGASAAVQLLGNHVDAIIVAPNEAPQVSSGEFRILASMSEQKIENFPDVPTFKEIGYDVQATAYRGFIAPKGTPQEILDYLHDLFKEAMEDPRYQDYMRTNLSNSYYLNGEDSYKMYESDYEKISNLAKELDL